MGMLDDAVSTITIRLQDDVSAGLRNVGEEAKRTESAIKSAGQSASASGGNISDLGNHAGTAHGKLGELGSSAQTTGGHLRSLGTATHEAGAHADEAGGHFEHLKSVFEHLGVHDLIGEMTGLGAVMGGAGLAGAFAETVKVSSDLESSFTAIEANGGLTKKQIEGIRDATMATARDIAAPLSDIEKGYESAAYFGLNLANSTKLVTASAKAAVITHAQTGDVVTATTRAMQSYGQSAQSAAGDIDTLVAAASAGNMHLQDMAQNAPKFMNFAAHAGIGLAQSTTAYAILSRSMDPQMAAQGEAAFIRGITLPGSTALKEEDYLKSTTGVDLHQLFSKDALSAPEGLTRALEGLNKATHGNAEELKALLPNSRAVNAAQSLLGQSTAEYDKALQHTLQSQGEIHKVYDEHKNDLDEVAGRLKNIGEEAAAAIGDQLRPAVAEAGVEVEQFAGFVEQHGPEISRITGEIGTAFDSVKEHIAGFAGLIEKAFSQKDVVGNFKDALGSLKDAGEQLFKALGNVADQLGIFSTKAGKGKGDADNLKTAVKDLSGFVKDVAGGFDDAAKFIDKFSGLILPLGGAILGYKAAVMAAQIATEAWTAAQGLLDIALDANPIGLVVAAIAGLVIGVKLAYDHVGWFRNAVNDAWATLKGWWGDLKSFASWLSTEVPKAVGDVVSFIQQHWSTLVGILTDPIGTIEHLWSEFGPTIMKFFGNLLGDIGKWAGDLLGKFGEWAGGWMGAIGNSIKNAAGAIKDALVGAFKDAVAGVKSLLEDSVKGWGKILSNIPGIGALKHLLGGGGQAPSTAGGTGGTDWTGGAPGLGNAFGFSGSFVNSGVEQGNIEMYRALGIGYTGDLLDWDYSGGPQDVRLPGGKNAHYTYLRSLYEDGPQGHMGWADFFRTPNNGIVQTNHMQSAPGLTPGQTVGGGTDLGMSGYSSGLYGSGYHLCVVTDANGRQYLQWLTSQDMEAATKAGSGMGGGGAPSIAGMISGNPAVAALAKAGSVPLDFGQAQSVFAQLGQQIPALVQELAKLPPEIAKPLEGKLADVAGKYESALRTFNTGEVNEDQRHESALAAIHDSFSQKEHDVLTTYGIQMTAQQEKETVQRAAEYQKGVEAQEKASEALRHTLADFNIKQDAATQAYLQRQEAAFTKGGDLAKIAVSELAKHLQIHTDQARAMLEESQRHVAANQAIADQSRQTAIDKTAAMLGISHQKAEALLQQHLGKLAGQEDAAIAKENQAHQNHITGLESTFEKNVQATEKLYQSVVTSLKQALDPSALYEAQGQHLQNVIKQATSAADAMVYTGTGQDTQAVRLGNLDAPGTHLEHTESLLNQTIDSIVQATQEEQKRAAAEAAVADQVNRALGDWTAVVSSIKSALDKTAATTKDKLTLDSYDHPIDGIAQNQGDLQSAIAAKKATDDLAAAETRATLAIDRGMGDFSTSVSKLKSDVDTGLSQAIAKYQYDLINHTGDLQQDATAIRIAAQASQQFSQQMDQASKIAAEATDVNAAFNEKQKEATDSVSTSMTELTQKIYDQANGITDTLPPLSQLVASVNAASASAAGFAAAADQAKQMVAQMGTFDSQVLTLTTAVETAKKALEAAYGAAGGKDTAEVLAARAAYEAAEKALSDYQNGLTADPLGPYAQQLADAQKAYNTALLNYENARASGSSDIGTLWGLVESAKKTLDSLQAYTNGPATSNPATQAPGLTNALGSTPSQPVYTQDTHSAAVLKATQDQTEVLKQQMEQQKQADAAKIAELEKANERLQYQADTLLEIAGMSRESLSYAPSGGDDFHQLANELKTAPRTYR